MGMQLEEALAELEQLGLKGDSQSQETSDSTENTVLAVSPVGTVEVGSTVTLTYAVPPSDVEVPARLEGQPESEVLAALAEAGLEASRAGTEASDTVAEGSVTRVSPESGNSVAVGSTVQYWVSGGPAATSSAPASTSSSAPASSSASTPAGTSSTAPTSSPAAAASSVPSAEDRTRATATTTPTPSS